MHHRHMKFLVKKSLPLCSVSTNTQQHVSTTLVNLYISSDLDITPPPPPPPRPPLHLQAPDSICLHLCPKSSSRPPPPHPNPSPLTCRQIPTLTRQPKLVLTALGDKPRPEKSLEKDEVRLIRGLSSAMTHSVRTQLRLTPRARRLTVDVPRPFVHNSITPYEQNVSRTGIQQVQGISGSCKDCMYSYTVLWYNINCTAGQVSCQLKVPTLSAG